MKSSGPRTWRTERRHEARNVLAIGTLVDRIAPWLTERERAAVDRCGAMIAEAAKQTLPFLAAFGHLGWPLIESVTDPGPSPDYEHDPGGWVTHFIVLPALQWHLEALTSVNRADEVAALAFADETLRVAQDDRLRYRVLVPLSGIYLDTAEGDVVSEGDISLHRLSEAEQGELFEQLNKPFVFSMRHANQPLVSLELRVSGPRTVHYMPSVDRALSLVTAFQLSGFPVAGHYCSHYSDPVWVSPGVPHMPLTLPSQTNKLSVLTASDFLEIIATGKRLDGYNMAQPRSPRDLALHRFVAGMARQNDADAVLDFAIALEALLLPYDQSARRGDLGYRFRIHGAHYLADGPVERQEFAKQLSDIYELRSRLVHGRKYPDPAEIAAARDRACEFARRGLRRAVCEGFPAIEEFHRMVLDLPAPPATPRRPASP